MNDYKASPRNQPFIHRINKLNRIQGKTVGSSRIHFATNRTAERPLRRLSRARGMRPLVAETAVSGRFATFSLGSSELPFGFFGTSLAPIPKGQCLLETQGLSPEARIDHKATSSNPLPL